MANDRARRTRREDAEIPWKGTDQDFTTKNEGNFL